MLAGAFRNRSPAGAVPMGLVNVNAAAAKIRMPKPGKEPIVDLQRFMGRWHVIASIPTWVEKNARNFTVTHRLSDDGTVTSRFSCSKGGSERNGRSYESRSLVRNDGSNAIWATRFVWPFKADFRILYLNDDYSQAIIGRDRRDFVWIMARTPSLTHADFFARAQLIREQGYDTGKLKLVPQQWDAPPIEFGAGAPA